MNDYFEGALAAATWCAIRPLGGREQMEAVEAPIWVRGWSDPVTLTHSVVVEWLGLPLKVTGVHLGPEPEDKDFYHRDADVHWNLRWSLLDGGEEIPEESLKRLPSEVAWLSIGQWLLGAQLALCISKDTDSLFLGEATVAYQPEHGSTAGDGWNLILRGFTDSDPLERELAFRLYGGNSLPASTEPAAQAPSPSADEICRMGMACARVPARGRLDMRALEPPVWDFQDIAPDTLGHFVYLTWLGFDLILWGQGGHVGPQFREFEWNHLTSNPDRHWVVDWVVDAEDDDSDSRALTEAELDLLPDRAAWDRVGEWLLGILMAARLSQSEVTSEELTQAIADNWGAFVAGFDE